jgi:putative ABC transport system substrate-binding protein
MRRREFITLLAGAAAWPARAQQPALPVIGFLSANRAEAVQHLTAAFREGLADSGFIENTNVAIEYRFADGQPERLPALALDLVRRRVALIYTDGLVTTMVAKGATSTIPIVFTTAFDPVNTGLVVSLNRPGANVTGASSIAGLLGAKRLEIVREVVPKPGLVAALLHAHNPMAEADKADLQQTAYGLGQRLEIFSAGSVEEIEAAFSKIAEMRANALLVNPDPFFFRQRMQIVGLAARHALPTLYYTREYPEVGGLISYGSRFAAAFRQAGNMVGQILKGAKPADLPVQQPTKFELVINLKTAKALGIEIPPTLLARADEVIE